MTTNAYYAHFDLAEAGQVFQQIAAALGKTPRQLLDDDDFSILDLLLSVDSPTPGQLRGTFKAGITMDVSYNPASLTVTQVKTYVNGQLSEEWSGTMTVEQFLSDAWPGNVYGTSRNDLLYVEGNGSLYAGPGSDILELSGNATGYGGSGTDTFVIFAGGQVKIADYQLGEKILFDSYDDWGELAAAFKGVTNAGANGFTLNFGGPGMPGPQWSLSIQGVALDQMRLEDLLVGQAAYDQVYAPVYAAFGLI